VTSEFGGLPLEERIRAYREHALKAVRAAEASDSKTAREHWLFVGLQWQQLAKDIELKLARGKIVPGINSE
jgi:hypothetical protein